jgi:RsiW-degrading membrane proteinase PrsW (M82 family)
MVVIVGLGLSLAATAVPTLIYTGLVWWCDRYEREPWPLLAATFLWGAIPAVILSLVIELILDIPLSMLRSSTAHDLLAAGGVAPIVEESVKAVALLGLFLLARQEFDNALDGIVYGALVGFGFAMTENVFYFMSVLLEEGWGAWTLVVFLRSVVFGFNHAFFTSLTGIGLGVARMTRHRWLRWSVPILALGAAILFHAVHNVGTTLADVACLSLGVSLLADWGGVWVVVAVIMLSWWQERQWMREFLADEDIPRAHRQAAVSARLWEHVPVASQIAHRSAGREYHQLLAELAFRKHRLARLGDEPGLRQEIARLRTRLQELQRDVKT